MATLKGFGQKVGHGTVVGVDAVLTADLAAPVKVVGDKVGSARDKVRQVRELRAAVKAARRAEELESEIAKGDALLAQLPTVDSPQVFAMLRQIIESNVVGMDDTVVPS